MAVSGSILYAGDNGDQMFRSTDSGKSWRPSAKMLLPANAITVFHGDVFMALNGGVFLSSNNGDSWVPAGLGARSVTSFAAADSMLYAGTDQGVYISIDLGDHWTAQDSGATYPRPSVYRLLKSGSHLLEIASDYGYSQYWYSTNDGVTWNAPASGLTTESRANFLVRIGADVYTGSDAVLYRSSDDGVNWVPVYTFLADTRTMVSLNDTLFVGTDSGAFRSVDQGKTWSLMNIGTIHEKGVKVLSSIGSTLVAAVGLGCYRSTNGGNDWSTANVGISNYQVLCFTSNGENLFAGTEEADAFASTDDGLNWTQSVTADIINYTLSSICSVGSRVFAVCGDGVLLTTNNGTSWTLTNNGFPILSYPDVAGVSSLCASGQTLFAGMQDGGVYRSTNLGANWVPVNSGIDNVTPMHLCSSGASVIGALKTGGIIRSTDNGSTWVTVTNGIPSAPPVMALFSSGSTVLAGIDSVVFYSTDSGASWASSVRLPDSIVYSLCMYQNNIFAGTDTGIFLSTNMGETWSSVTTGLPDSVQNPFRAVTSLSIQGSELFAGYSDLGIWRRPLSDMVAVDDVLTANSEAFQGVRSYPNPFAKAVTISVLIPISGSTRVLIVNSIGQVVTTLFDGELDAGEHSFVWDAKDMPAGTYFCQISSSAGVGIRHAVPMVLAH